MFVCIRHRNNTEFLPAALIIGLQPAVPLSIPIVVVAEDGVTSQRYYVTGRLHLQLLLSLALRHIMY